MRGQLLLFQWQRAAIDIATVRLIGLLSGWGAGPQEIYSLLFTCGWLFMNDNYYLSPATYPLIGDEQALLLAQGV